ncbi:MAG: hypothetical protein P4L40_02020 [Terracidiphilus sp.]|nr:hypothetical protein [Terracidiphilus sp.]
MCVYLCVCGVWCASVYVWYVCVGGACVRARVRACVMVCDGMCVCVCVSGARGG